MSGEIRDLQQEPVEEQPQPNPAGVPPTPAEIERAMTAKIKAARELVLKEPIALQKWGTVVDDVIISQNDIKRIKDIIRDRRDDYYSDAVQLTLQTFFSYEPAEQVAINLLQVLKKHGLGRLSDELARLP